MHPQTELRCGEAMPRERPPLTFAERIAGVTSGIEGAAKSMAEFGNAIERFQKQWAENVAPMMNEWAIEVRVRAQFIGCNRRRIKREVRKAIEFHREMQRSK